jgi:hypothetical protein
VIDFEGALAIEPNNKTLLDSLKITKKKISDIKAAEKKMYSNLLNKNIYETKNLCNYSDSLNPMVSINLN